jgi:hypothetical protein
MKQSKENVTKLFWSRVPGKFVDKYTGKDPWASTNGFGGPSFSGRVKDWYETLAETIFDGVALIHKRRLRPPTLLEAGPDVMTILRHTNLLRPNPDANYDGLFGSSLNVKERRDMPRNEIRVVFFSNLKNTLGKNGVVEVEVLPEPERQDELIIEILDLSVL